MRTQVKIKENILYLIYFLFIAGIVVAITLVG